MAGLGSDAIYATGKVDAAIWVLSGSLVLRIETEFPNYLPSNDARKAALIAAAKKAVKGL